MLPAAVGLLLGSGWSCCSSFVVLASDGLLLLPLPVLAPAKHVRQRSGRQGGSTAPRPGTGAADQRPTLWLRGLIKAVQAPACIATREGVAVGFAHAAEDL
jgi:hypothetical protein